MANWERAIDDFERKVRTNIVKIHARTAFAMRDSVVDGSPTTGAPGQPIDTSTLKNSWILSHPSPFFATLQTDVQYAEAIEEGIVKPHQRGPYTRKDGTPVRRHSVRGYPMIFRSKTGGSHSVKLTRIGIQKIADKATRDTVK